MRKLQYVDIDALNIDITMRTSQLTLTSYIDME
jgi:hypothetical protein